MVNKIMKRNYLKKLFVLLFILTLSISTITACNRENKDEGNDGNSTSDGTDGSANEDGETLDGTDSSDSSGGGSNVSGDETPTEAVAVTVIPEAEIRALAIGALGNATVNTIYQMDYQNEVYRQLETLKQKSQYSLDTPLFVLNPYGTNRSSMYVFLNTEENANLEYTVSVDDERIPDFTRHLYTNENLDPMTEHEGIVTGLVPGRENIITFRSFDDKNNITTKKIYTVEVPDYGTITETVLDVTQELSLEELSAGLYCIFGYNRGSDDEPKHILFYDNNGVLRGEIPVYVKGADVRIEFVDDKIIYPCTDNQFALVDKSGRVVNLYTLEGYSIHHDFDYDADNNRLITLATNHNASTTEDSVVALDLKAGSYRELFNFTTIFPDLASKAKVDKNDSKGSTLIGDGSGWLQLNSLQIHDTDSIIVSSRELSSIIEISDIFENPEIDYIIADPSIWANTNYKNYLYNQKGSFTNHAGQYNVMYSPDDTLGDDQFYLHFYNSNYGYSSAYPELDFSTIAGVGSKDKEATSSFYYKYLVDEDKRTYELVDSISVPYSRIGSTQDIDSNHVIASGTAGIFGEYDAKGNLIAQYNVKLADNAYMYRVYKYKMSGHWFN